MRRGAAGRAAHRAAAPRPQALTSICPKGELSGAGVGGGGARQKELGFPPEEEMSVGIDKLLGYVHR